VNAEREKIGFLTQRTPRAQRETQSLKEGAKGKRFAFIGWKSVVDFVDEKTIRLTTAAINFMVGYPYI
jgi:hypothetical protein